MTAVGGSGSADLIVLGWKHLYLDLDVGDTYPTDRFAVEYFSCTIPILVFKFIFMFLLKFKQMGSAIAYLINYILFKY